MLEIDTIKKNVKKQLLLIKDELAKERERKKEAGKEGDLRENSEYADAESRIIELEQQLVRLDNKLLKINEMEDTPYIHTGFVSLKSTVTIHRSDKDEAYTFTIVPSELGDFSNGLVPVDSKVGEALIGKQEQEKIFINTGLKSYTACILRIN